jgi:hypothetical protein
MRRRKFRWKYLNCMESYRWNHRESEISSRQFVKFSLQFDGLRLWEERCVDMEDCI